MRGVLIFVVHVHAVLYFTERCERTYILYTQDHVRYRYMYALMQHDNVDYVLRRRLLVRTTHVHVIRMYEHAYTKRFSDIRVYV